MTVIGSCGVVPKWYTIFGLLRGTVSHFQRFPRELRVHLPFTLIGAYVPSLLHILSETKAGREAQL